MSDCPILRILFRRTRKCQALAPAEGGRMAEGSTGLEDALARLLRADVAGRRRLPGGASRETWSFTAGGEPLIVRRDPPGRIDAAAMAREAALLASAAGAGVPVPRLVAHGDDLDGTPFLVME